MLECSLAELASDSMRDTYKWKNSNGSSILINQKCTPKFSPKLSALHSDLSQEANHVNVAGVVF